MGHLNIHMATSFNRDLTVKKMEYQMPCFSTEALVYGLLCVFVPLFLSPCDAVLCTLFFFRIEKMFN